MRKALFLVPAAAPLSKILPQPQACACSGKGGPSFFAPQAERVLLDGSHPPIFIQFLPLFVQLIP
ncbi:MAG: hypothetical protein LBU32_06745 [Clostridiales bacterium]|nr:hypothetical protein [Clostridiales bacterium]